MLETRASEVVLLVDSSKFRAPAEQVVCGLEAILTLITDDGLSEAEARMVRRSGIKLIVVKGHITEATIKRRRKKSASIMPLLMLETTRNLAFNQVARSDPMNHLAASIAGE